MSSATTFVNPRAGRQAGRQLRRRRTVFNRRSCTSAHSLFPSAAQRRPSEWMKNLFKVNFEISQFLLFVDISPFIKSKEVHGFINVSRCAQKGIGPQIHSLSPLLLLSSINSSSSFSKIFPFLQNYLSLPHKLHNGLRKHSRLQMRSAAQRWRKTKTMDYLQLSSCPYSIVYYFFHQPRGSIIYTLCLGRFAQLKVFSFDDTPTNYGALSVANNNLNSKMNPRANLTG